MEWIRSSNELRAQLRFKDFKEAFAFMTEVALIAERLQHHPNWSNCWNVVEIRLSTHDAGNTITEKDEQLALEIAHTYAKYA